MTRHLRAFERVWHQALDERWHSRGASWNQDWHGTTCEACGVIHTDDTPPSDDYDDDDDNDNNNDGDAGPAVAAATAEVPQPGERARVRSNRHDYTRVTKRGRGCCS